MNTALIWLGIVVLYVLVGLVVNPVLVNFFGHWTTPEDYQQTARDVTDHLAPGEGQSMSPESLKVASRVAPVIRLLLWPISAVVFVLIMVMRLFARMTK